MNEKLTLPDISKINAELYGDRTAFIFEERITTFSAFEQHSNQVAHALIAEGLKPQSRVGILDKDSDYAYQLLFGCAKSNTVLVGINWRLTADEISYIAKDSGIEILFTGQDFFHLAEKVAAEVPQIKKIVVLRGSHPVWPGFADWKNNYPSDVVTNVSYNEETPVVQLYTSGTTGHPKGVQLAHYTFFRLMNEMKKAGDHWMNLNPDDNILVCVPIFHIGGMWWAVQSFIAGSKTIILESFVGWKVLEAIQTYKITKTAMVPAMIQLCLNEPTCSNTDFSSLKAILYGGSPITPVLLKQAIQTFQCKFYQIYGMTETGNMAVCLRPQDHSPEGAKKKNAAGKPLPSVQIKIIDQQGNILPPGQVGEICIHSPARMIGYWNNEKATQEILRNGWIYTGDAGYLDEEGYVYVCDRIKDMIICAGENIFPAEIEAAIAEHPAVAECAVIGIPDDLWGEAVKAFVVLKPHHELKARDLISFLRSKIADYKIPKQISFEKALPRNASGKLLKRQLKEPYWQGRERMVN